MMKKVLFIITAILIAAALAACSAPAEAEQSAPPQAAGSVSATASPSPAPSPTVSVSPFPSVSDSAYKQPTEDTVIIADSEGQVYFGYSGGEWLNHSEAGVYCGNSMTFNVLSLSGISDTVTSEGAVKGSFLESYKNVNGDAVLEEHHSYMLNLSEPVDSWLCYINPDRLPKITPVSDYSLLLPIIRKLIDENLGPGVLEAKISSAVETDIDKDGKPETIINAANEQDDLETQEDSESYISYSITCAIRQDGSFVFLDQHYGDSFEDQQGCSVEGILDVDGDGKYEILMHSYGYEVTETSIYKIADHKLKWAVACGWAS